MFKRARSIACLCIAATLGTPTLANTNSLELPDIGTAAGGTLTIDQELIYGDAYMRIIRNSQPIVNDPVLNQYIDTLGHRLVANANDVKTPFQFFMIRDRNINAFAFFGGYVALHSGLFLHAQSESELASVLAHEIAHVTQRHLARSMEGQARRTPATIAALAASVLLAIAAPEAGIAALTATTAGNMQSQINYTRSNEKEADRFGINTLAKAGFDVNAMPRFFGRLADEYRYASTPPPMLLTHPLPQDRITDSRARARSYPPLKLAPSLDYHLARSRIVARYAGINNDAALDWFERQLKKAPKAIVPSLEYGQALVYLDSKKLDKAEPILTKLMNSDPTNLFYLDAISDLHIEQKGSQRFGGVVVDGHAGEYGVPARENIVEHGCIDLLLVAEVIQHVRFGQFGPFGDVLDGGTTIAVQGKFLFRCRQNDLVVAFANAAGLVTPGFALAGHGHPSPCSSAGPA